MADDLKLIIQELFDINAIRFGEFKLKSGILSPIYFNLRVIIGYPNLLRRISELLYNAAKSAGKPYLHLLSKPTKHFVNPLNPGVAII